MKQYKDLLQRVVGEGIWKENRTGIPTKSVIGAHMQFDLSKDLFPLVTIKQTYWKQAVAEMLCFLRGYDNASDFRKMGCTVWDANANENEEWLENAYRKGEDDLGAIYRWRRLGYYKKVETNFVDKPKEKFICVVNKLVDIDYSSNKHKVVGKEFSSNNCGDFVVIKEFEKGNGSKELIFNIQFISTGFILERVRKAEILKGEVKDPYFPIVFGVGAIGDLSKCDPDLCALLKNIWNNILLRCYTDYESQDHRWYKNCFVEDRWLIFENFVNDFKNIPNWELKLVFPKEYTLDKDFSGSNKYSLSTCRWSSKKEQSINTKSSKSFRAINLITGETFFRKGMSSFVEEFGLSKNLCNLFCNYEEGKSYICGDWEITKLTIDIVRYLEIDELKLVYAKLKLGIDDRRLVTVAYHPELHHRMALPPCHLLHQFSIQGDELHLCMYQRSADLGLGIPFNIVGYSWLLLVMAQITGLKPGKFNHFIADAHIYEDHIDGVTTMLSREPKEQTAKMIINPEIKTLEDLETWVTVDDFSIVEYNHHGTVKMDMAV